VENMTKNPRSGTPPRQITRGGRVKIYIPLPPPPPVRYIRHLTPMIKKNAPTEAKTAFIC